MPDAFTRKLNALSPLGPDNIAALAAALRPLPPVPAGSKLGIAGKEGAVRVLLSGLAYRYNVTRAGGRQISAFLLPGDFCDLTGALLNPLHHEIHAVQASQFGIISRTGLMALADARPAVMRALWMCTARDEATLREWLTRVARRDANQRLAHLFCELQVRVALQGKAHEGGFRLQMGQALLADAVGLSVVHTNRSLKELRDRGLMTFQGGSALIPDLNRLRSYADFNGSYLGVEHATGEGGAVAASSQGPMVTFTFAD